MGRSCPSANIFILQNAQPILIQSICGVDYFVGWIKFWFISVQHNINFTWNSTRILPIFSKLAHRTKNDTWHNNVDTIKICKFYLVSFFRFDGYLTKYKELCYAVPHKNRYTLLLENIALYFFFLPFFLSPFTLCVIPYHHFKRDCTPLLFLQRLIYSQTSNWLLVG
jgi:hypothetical protein